MQRRFRCCTRKADTVLPSGIREPSIINGGKSRGAWRWDTGRLAAAVIKMHGNRDVRRDSTAARDEVFEGRAHPVLAGACGV